MTTKQIENKVSDLEWWLKHNPNHPNHGVILKDKREFERKLAAKQSDEILTDE